MLRREANQKYSDARQQEYQSVREFDNYLRQWETRLPYQYSEEQRKDHLRSRLNRDIRAEALKYPYEPDTYEAFVGHMQKIEDSMFTRWHARKAGQKRGRTFFGNKPKQPDPNVESSESVTETFHPAKRRGITCHYFHKPGHVAKECYKKIRDENPKKQSTSAMEPKN
jgi:hypothetical protein